MRYYTPPTQQIVNMESPLNVDFYRQMLDKSQSNLDNSTAQVAKFQEDVNGIKYKDQATRDRVLAQAQEQIKGALDADFVSPSRTAQSVMKASQALSQWKNLNDSHLEQIKLQQEMKARYGSNYVGNDVASMSLTDDKTGELVDPSKLQAISGNGEDLQKAFMNDNGHLATRAIKGRHSVRSIMGGKFIEFSDSIIKGLTPEEAKALGNPEVVQEYMTKMPDLVKAVVASGQDPEKYFAKNISRIAGQLVQGTQENVTHAANPDWAANMGISTNKSSNNTVTFQPNTGEAAKEKSDIERVRNLINNTVTGPTVGGLNTIHGVGSNPTSAPWSQKQDEFKKISDKYGTMWKGIIKGFDKDLHTPEGQEAYRKLQNTFFDVVSKHEEPSRSPYTVWDFKDLDVDKNLTRAVIIGTSSKDIKFKDKTGKEVSSNDIFKNGGDNMVVMPRNDGNLHLVTKDAKSYTIPIFDEQGRPTGNVDDRTTSLLKFQRDLYHGLFDATDKNLNKEMSMNIPIYNKFEDAQKNPIAVIPIYKYVLDPKNSRTNVLVRAYYDPKAREYCTINGQKWSVPESGDGFDEVSAENAEVLKSLNNVKLAK